MINIDFTYIIPMLLLLISFLVVFLIGRWKTQKNKNFNIIKAIPLFSVIGMLIGVFLISNYYEKQKNIEIARFMELNKNDYYNDSVLTTIKSRKQAHDSLVTLEKKLKELLERIKKQEKVLGKNDPIKKDVKDKILKTKAEIDKIDSYNKIVDASSFLQNGYITSGNTTNFNFICPADRNSEFIDLILTFNDQNLIDKIAYMYVSVSEKKTPKEYIHVFSQTYKPQKGINAFQIRNYLSKKNRVLEIGYFLKTEIGKDLPRLEKISCWSD